MKFNKPNNQQTAQKGSSRNSIMVVDDSKFARNILCDILRSDSFSVVAEAKNGVEAVEMARDKKPQYIFLDVEMPMLDGLGAIPKILEVNPGAHIIMCTAMGQKNIIVEAVKAGAKDYVIKPYKKENILRVLNLIIESKKKGESAEASIEEDNESNQEPDNAELVPDEQPMEELITVETFFGREAGGAAAEDAGMIESAAAAGDVNTGMIMQEAAAATELLERAELQGAIEQQDVTGAEEEDNQEEEFEELLSDTVFMLETLEESLEEGKLSEINELEGFADILGEPVTVETDLMDETVIISESEKTSWIAGEAEIKQEAADASEVKEATAMETSELEKITVTEVTVEALDASETKEAEIAEKKAEALDASETEEAEIAEEKAETLDASETEEAEIAEEKAEALDASETEDAETTEVKAEALDASETEEAETTEEKAEALDASETEEAETTDVKVEALDPAEAEEDKAVEEKAEAKNTLATEAELSKEKEAVVEEELSDEEKTGVIEYASTDLIEEKAEEAEEAEEAIVLGQLIESKEANEEGNLFEAKEAPEGRETIDTIEASEETENSPEIEEAPEAVMEAQITEVSLAEEAEEILEELNSSKDNDLRELLEEIAELQEASDKRSYAAEREAAGIVKPHKAAGKADSAVRNGKKVSANEEFINSSLDYFELSYLWKDRFENLLEEVENNSRAGQKLPFHNVVYLRSRSMLLPDMDQSKSNLLTDIISSYLSLDNRLQTDESSYERQTVSYQDGARLFTGNILEDRTDISAGYAMSDILKWNEQKKQSRISISSDKLLSAITQLVQGKSERTLM